MIRVQLSKDSPAIPVPLHVEAQGQAAIDAYLTDAAAKCGTQEQANAHAEAATGAWVAQMEAEAKAKADAAKAAAEAEAKASGPARKRTPTTE